MRTCNVSTTIILSANQGYPCLILIADWDSNWYRDASIFWNPGFSIFGPCRPCIQFNKGWMIPGLPPPPPPPPRVRYNQFNVIWILRVVAFWSCSINPPPPHPRVRYNQFNVIWILRVAFWSCSINPQANSWHISVHIVSCEHVRRCPLIT